jgi:hypothetical protein
MPALRFVKARHIAVRIVSSVVEELMSMMNRIVAFAVVMVFPTVTFAHGGGLDRNGCHTNRKTGDYHCHGGRTAPAPQVSTVKPQADPLAMTYVAQAVDPAANDRASVKTAQTLLRALGYTPTEFGTIDQRTRAAIESFQALEGMEKDGTVTPMLLLRLAQSLANKCANR